VILKAAELMGFLATVKSISSCLVPSAWRRSQESGQDQAQADPQNALNPSLPPLKPLDLPKILLEHQFALADQGWTTVTYDTPSDSLYYSSQALLQASKAFFDLPQSYKEGFKTQIGSEEGWSRVEGEKEFITLRSSNNTPAELKDAASAYWSEAGGLLNQLLGCIARSLGLPAEALTIYSEPCSRLQPQKTATMLRLFRYEGFEGEQSKTVAEGKLGHS
jgi:isopenicillin N synthase-like dioxygenase